MVDFAESDSSQSGVDTRVGHQESVVQSILEAVHAASGGDGIGGAESRSQSGPAMAPPLYDFINPDALEALYAHAREHQGTAQWRATFQYADAEVSLTSKGTVTVEPESAAAATQRAHTCPQCEDGTVGANDDRFVVGATLQCPECGNEWDVSF
jgi:predicted RNA-binding Zn-ribbon protein involved in translation (DUF1610 family)